MRSFLWAIVLAAATVSWAHPHIYVNATASAIFDQSGFTGVQNHWTFDDIYSTAMFAAADADKSGDLSAKELAMLQSTVLDPHQKYKYYNYVLQDNDFLNPTSVQNFKAKMEGGKLTVDFIVHFSVKAQSDYIMLLVVVDDPSNYIHFTTDMSKATVTVPDELEVDYFDDSLEGLTMMRSFRSDVRGLYLRFKK